MVRGLLSSRAQAHQSHGPLVVLLIETGDPYLLVAADAQSIAYKGRNTVTVFARTTPLW